LRKDEWGRQERLPLPPAPGKAAGSAVGGSSLRFAARSIEAGGRNARERANFGDAARQRTARASRSQLDEAKPSPYWRKVLQESI
jgi:hypothetical protein